MKSLINFKESNRLVLDSFYFTTRGINLLLIPLKGERGNSGGLSGGRIKRGS